MSFAAYTDGLASLFEAGGATMWAILGSSLLLWGLLAERYWFHRFEAPGLRSRLVGEWTAQTRPPSSSLLRRRIDAFVSDLRAETDRNMQALQALVGILPLLGLLGTVSGMIKVFEVITVFGTGNTRGMASGISEALVTTMAGLFTALSGLYFVSDLEQRSDELARRLHSELSEES